MKKTDNIIYDDNYGYRVEVKPDPDEFGSFETMIVQDSEKKKCTLCDEEVFIRTSYDKCNSCMEKLERGQEW